MRSLLLLLALAALPAASVAAQTGLTVGSEAPGFSATSLSGKQYDLAELRGSVVVLTFWSTRCAICHEEMPKLDRLVESFKGRNVVSLSLTMENAEQIHTYLRRNRFAAEIVPDSFGVVLKYADRGREGNLDMGFPSYFVIDQEGRIRFRSSGFDKTQRVGSAVGGLLAR